MAKLTRTMAVRYRRRKLKKEIYPGSFKYNLLNRIWFQTYVKYGDRLTNTELYRCDYFMHYSWTLYKTQNGVIVTQHSRPFYRNWTLATGYRSPACMKDTWRLVSEDMSLLHTQLSDCKPQGHLLIAKSYSRRRWANFRFLNFETAF
jgi:hypothetical protein